MSGLTSTLTGTLWRWANNLGVLLYRNTGGRLGGRARGMDVLLLTVAGRRTGRLHTVPVVFERAGGAYLVAASGGGTAAEPQWIRNLRATSEATVEIGRDRFDVSAEVLRGAERDAAWAEIVAAHPFFADYEKKSGRTIAVARLTPAVWR